MSTNNWTSLLPGRNPTGTTLASEYSLLPATGSTSGTNPVVPPLNLSSGAPATNPYDSSSVVPTFGANTGGYSTSNLLAPGSTPSNTISAAQSSPIGGMNLMTNKDLGRMYNSLKSTYGDGIAHAIMNFLSTGAGFNQDAINNIFAALQPGFERSQQNLIEQFSTSGNRFGSGAQIGLADLMSQQNLEMGQIETQMYEQSVNDFINTLMGVAGGNMQRKANSPGMMDTLGGILNLVGAGAGAASSAGIGGTAGSILDVISSLGGIL